MKNKIYASVQHLVGEIHPVTLSPYFDSARIAIIPKKYTKKITFVFAADTARFNRYERNIYIRDRTDAIMREWTIFSDGKPITNKDNIIKIDGVYFVKGNIPLYLSEYNSMKELSKGIKKYFNFYNTERFHQSLDYCTPNDIYYESIRKVGSF